MKTKKEVVYPVNDSGEIIRETRVFHFLPTKGFVDYSLGLVEDKIRWFRFSNVRQIFENGSWKTFEFMD